MITITHFENKDSKGIKSFILREDDDFICKVYWPKDSQTESRKIKFEDGLRRYIEAKSEIPEYNYLVCWKKVRFNDTLKHLDLYPTLRLRSTQTTGKYVKKISDKDE